MTIEIKVPEFPESVTDGTLINWHKKIGENIARDEVIADIETDKVVFEVPSLEAGVVKAIQVEEGAVVESGQVIALVDESAAAVASEKIDQALQQAAEPAHAETEDERLSPAAKKMAVENGLDTSRIAGSGKGGRILKEDVIAQLQGVPEEKEGKRPLHVVQPEMVGERPEKRVPMTRLRARIAERLVEAQQTAAILTTFNEVNMQPVMDLRRRHRDDFEARHGVRLGFMSFFVKAAVEALKQFPEVNASIEGEEVVYHGYFDIGIAVGTPRGLVVPIIRNADHLSMAELEQQISDFGQRAQGGHLSLDEITGGTFSITNGGVFGSMLSTPILNPPQSAILGMHKIQQRPVVEEGEIVIRPIMYLALSYDHRLVDGREAVQFLVAIKEAIEDPTRLLLEI